MPDSTISGLTDLGIPEGDEYVEVVATPSGTPASRRTQLFKTGGFVGLARRRFYAFNDYNSSAAEAHWTQTLTGTGATTITVSPPNNEIGIGFRRIDLGTVATNSVYLGSSSQSPLRLFGGASRYAIKLGATQLSNATDDYTVRMGFIDSNSAESDDGVYFRYNHAVNAGKWQAVCRVNGVETAVDTGVSPVAGEVLRRFEVRTNSAANSATFYIDGTLVATITTNIPNSNIAAHETGYGLYVQRAAGTAALPSATIDYQEVDQIFNTAR